MRYSNPSKIQVMLVLLTLFTWLCVHAQDYLKIYRNDQKVNEFYTTEVDSIVMLPKEDGTGYNVTYWTSDTVFTIPANEHDSTVIGHITIEEIAREIESATTVAGELFSRCLTISELVSHIDEIRRADGVEDVYFSDQTLFVKIKGWGTIQYCYPPTMPDVEENNQLLSLVNKTRAANSYQKQLYAGAKSVCIANWFSNNSDPAYDDARTYGSATKAMFDRLDFRTAERSPTPDFLTGDIYNYDIVFLITHGSYDPYTGLHWLATSQEIETGIFIPKDEVYKMLRNKNMLLAQRGMTIMCFYDNRKEGSNVYCYGISNNYIASRGGTFSNSGNAIIFNTACESLKGNYNLVNTYLNKGAGLYIGYNDINWCGRIQGAYFFYYLLNGMSVQKAINNVRTTIYSQEPNNRKKEIVDQKKVFGAYNRSVKEARMLSIIHTKMGEIKDESNDEGIKIKINGSVKLLTPHDVDHTYGFYLSEKNDFESGVMLPGFKLGSSGCRVTDGHTVELEQTLTKKELEKGKVYYVCPYLYDGESYCLAEKLEPLYVNGVETSAPEYAKGDIALLCGQFVNGKPVQEAGFRLGYDSDYNQYTDFHWDKAVGQTSATFNLSVYGLHPSMTYYYKAYIKVDGEYYYGNTISFNTDEVIDGSITNYVPQNATYVVDDDGEYVKFDFNMTYTAPPMFETTTQWGLYIANLDNTEKTYVWPATKLKISGESQNLTLYVKKSDFDQKNFSTFQATKRLKMGVYKCVKYGSDTQYYFFSPSQDVNLVYEQKPSLTFNTAYYGATKAVSQNGEEKWQTPIWGTYTVNGSFWLDKIDLVVILGNADDNVGTWKIEGDGKHDFEIYYTYSKNQSLNTAFRFDMILSNGSKVSSTNAIKITGSDKVANVSIISTTRSADSTRGGHTGRGVLKMKSFSTKPISNSGQHNERKVNERTLIAIERNNR